MVLIFWRFGLILLVLCFLFFGTLFASFVVYKQSSGRLYQIFRRVPKRYLFFSFIMAFLFGVLSMIPDFFNILLSPIMIKPVNIREAIIAAPVQCLLITTFGFPIVWLSYNIGIPLAHKVLYSRFDSANITEEDTVADHQ
jgi:hypothetical protein